MIQWVLPQVFGLLLLLPLILLIPAKQPQTALWVANAQLQHRKAAKDWWSRLLVILALAALVIAMAQPERVGDPIEVSDSQRDMVLVVDLSGSMGDRDMRYGASLYRRIDVVKQVLNGFIDGRDGDRMGLVFFADSAYVQAPVTRDLESIQQWLTETAPHMIGSNTAIGEGIALGVRQVRDLDAKDKVVILLSDGANTAGEVSPMEAASWALDQGVKVYTVGISGFFGGADNATLRQVANLTGARFFSARDAVELVEIYREIDRLEPVERQTDPVRINEPLYYWPLSIAVLLLMTLFVWRGRLL
ncbi:VWA domain-containing protein [Salinibius halmophilus]|uniref:VWA domain-containing protein n=1 Tax=Salinibius halmophilus TaxID=1853216 RepID=UPI000E671755|nr:VWA domain-containing protein [Salinibius halmophilus]